MTTREWLLADLADAVCALRGSSEGVLRAAQVFAQNLAQCAAQFGVMTVRG
jgi:hypothetical protein